MGAAVKAVAPMPRDASTEVALSDGTLSSILPTLSPTAWLRTVTLRSPPNRLDIAATDAGTGSKMTTCFAPSSRSIFV